jgi:homoserine kinase
MQLPARYGVAIVVPDFVLPTAEARAVLPQSYSRADAVFNIQRSALLIAAMLTQTTDAFHAALEDRLHQPYRQHLVPGLAEMLELRAEGLLGCALSGAGPSVLVFYERGHETVCERFRELFHARGHSSEILWAHIPDHGYDLLRGL